MKVNPLNIEMDRMNKQSNIKGSDNNFHKIITKLTEDDNTNQTDEKLTMSNKATAFYGNNLTTGNRVTSTEINSATFKAFIKESMNVQLDDIKQCIDAICSDETGEKIDIEALNAYLELYISGLEE